MYNVYLHCTYVYMYTCTVHMYICILVLYITQYGHTSQYCVPVLYQLPLGQHLILLLCLSLVRVYQNDSSYTVSAQRKDSWEPLIHLTCPALQTQQLLLHIQQLVLALVQYEHTEERKRKGGSEGRREEEKKIKWKRKRKWRKEDGGNKLRR